jgi:fibronectin type 3 domain-containing protein
MFEDTKEIIIYQKPQSEGHVNIYNGQKKKDKQWSIKHYTENFRSI